MLCFFLIGELTKFTEDKWLRGRSNRGSSLGLIAAAVAQAVAGQVPTQAVPLTGGAATQQTPSYLTVDFNNAMQCRRSSDYQSGRFAANTSTNLNSNKAIPPSSSHLLPRAVDGCGERTSASPLIFQSHSGGTSINKKLDVNGDATTKTINDDENIQFPNPRFISDGISQLTMGSFQVRSTSHV